MADRQLRRYVATYAFDGRAWIVQFREPDIATFGRTLGTAKRYARSALAVQLEVDDLDSAGIEVVDDVRLPASVSREVDRLVKKRSTVVALRTEVARSTRTAAGHLRALGLSTRDVGEILGVSGARIHQIDRESKARA